MTPISGFRFHDSPVQWVLAPRITIAKTLKTLLEDFYHENSWSEPLYQPLAWVLDPEKDGRKIYSETTNVIVAPYRKGYFVVIEKQFAHVEGPHAARLMWKSPDSEIIWIAVLQISEMFYSRDRMQAALIASITAREFYQSEATQEILINF